MTCYIITAYRDVYSLPLACLDTVPECLAYIGCSRAMFYHLLAGDYPHFDGYCVEAVEI